MERRSTEEHISISHRLKSRYCVPNIRSEPTRAEAYLEFVWGGGEFGKRGVFSAKQELRNGGKKGKQRGNGKKRGGN